MGPPGATVSFCKRLRQEIMALYLSRRREEFIFCSHEHLSHHPPMTVALLSWASFHALYVSDLVPCSSVSLFRVHQEWRWDSKLDYTQKCYFIAHLPVLQGDKGEIGLKGEKVVCSLKNSMNMGMASSLLHSLECPCRVTLELLESLLRWR